MYAKKEEYWLNIENGKYKKADNPKFFIVPSATVARKVKKDEIDLFTYKHNRPVKHNDMRLFRIGLDDKSKGLPIAEYENKWSYFDE